MINKITQQSGKSDETFWRLEVAILPGKLNEFRSIVREMTDASNQEDGTLAYEWYFSADKTICHTYERYRDSEAVITHAESFGKFFMERFLKTCRQTGLGVYGSPNAAAKALLDAFNPTYYSKLSGTGR